MADTVSPSLVRQLGSLFDGGTATGLSDRQLLERYVAGGREPAGETAFAALVTRHGPMVLGVCRQLLGDRHHAEDAFQAVFLVLARKAGSIRDPDLLGNWLYGVALRTGAQGQRPARPPAQDTRRTDARGASGQGMSPPWPSSRCSSREQAEALHREIDRLPDSFRAAVVLCYFEGLSPDEAAQRLRWPAGTLRSRLVRAREKLRRGLALRGVALPAAALAAALAPRSAAASVSPRLCDATARAATAYAARHAASGVLTGSAAAMAREVLRSLLLQKLKATSLCLLLLATLVTGAGLLSHSPAPGQVEPRPAPAPGLQVAAQPDDVPRPAPGRMFVVGRVLDPQGKPVPHATTMVYASLKWPGRGDRLAPMWPAAIGKARSDGSGWFRLDAPRISSARHDQTGAVAIAPGYGAGWVELDPDADQPDADITLRPEQVIQGRLFDVQGRPVRGVKVAVETMGTIVTGDPIMTAGETEGPYFLRNQPADLPAWPRPATTDADGRFTIRGVGRGIRIGLSIDDPRFARQRRVEVDTNGDSDTKNVTMAVEPARIINGRVTYADTGRTAHHAVVGISIQTDDGGSTWEGDVETDDQGRFHANSGSGHRYLLYAFPPEHGPYLNGGATLEWPKGAIEHSVELTLPRGVLIRGKVTEEGSDKPVAGARIGYISNPDRDQQTGAWNTRATTAADGSFQFGVMPAPGYLTVLGPGEDYVLREIGQRMALTGQPGGRRLYAHAFHALDLKPDSARQEVAITLRPSAAVQGQVVGPDGQPVRDALVISRVVLPPLPTWVSFLFWTGNHHGAVRDGHFAVHGLADDTEVPVYFLDARHELGATVFLSSKSAQSGPVTVRLQPCGQARARLVDPAGKPVARSRDSYGSHMTMLVVTPGPSRSSQDQADQARLAADQDFLARFDSIHYQKGLISDSQGQLALPALIPGATYRIYDGTMGDEAGPRLRKEFTVKPGESLDLGDILVEKPQA